MRVKFYKQSRIGGVVLVPGWYEIEHSQDESGLCSIFRKIFPHLSGTAGEEVGRIRYSETEPTQRRRLA